MFRRILAAVTILAAAAIALIAVWPQLFGFQRLPIAAQVVSLRGMAIVVVLFLIVVLFFLAIVAPSFRRFCAALGLVCAVFVVASAIVLASRGLGNNSLQTKGPADITVLSWNTLGEAVGAEAIADLAIETDADIVALPETTTEMATRIAELMDAGGQPMWAHTFSYDRIAKARSTSLLISPELGDYSVDTDHRTTNVLPSLVAKPVDGTGPTIVAVHAVAPIPSELNHWKLDLRWLKSACSGGNIIMAGDFNSTIDHFAGLASADGASIGHCVDAALLSGNAAIGTWPTVLPPLLGAPIDHVMATPNWTVTGMRVIESRDDAGSDHRPIVVQLSPRGTE